MTDIIDELECPIAEAACDVVCAIDELDQARGLIRKQSSFLDSQEQWVWIASLNVIDDVILQALAHLQDARTILEACHDESPDI